jgi:hypothetical protein
VPEEFRTTFRTAVYGVSKKIGSLNGFIFVRE